MKGIFVGLMLTLTSLTANAEDYDGIPKRFFENLFAHNYKEAFDILNPTKKTSGNDNEEFDFLTVFTDYLAKNQDKSDYKYYELVSEEKIGTRYVKLIYVMGLKNSQSGMSMELYKPDSEWQAINFSYQAKYADLIKDKSSKE
jgi:hypothetical protein